MIYYASADARQLTPPELLALLTLVLRMALHHGQTCRLSKPVQRPDEVLFLVQLLFHGFVHLTSKLARVNFKDDVIIISLKHMVSAENATTTL